MVSSRARPMEEADLFSTASLQSPLRHQQIHLNPNHRQKKKRGYCRLVISVFAPRDLPGGIKQLTDQEFDRLLAAVLAEQQRRGRKLPSSRKTSRKPLIKEVALPLTLKSSTLFALPSRPASRHHVFPDSLGFLSRTSERC